MMYCPTCFNHSLSIQNNGVIHLTINGLQRDNGRFLFSTHPNDRDKVIQDFKKKAEEFFKWYSNFMNKEPIYVIELLTNDMKCDHGCGFTPTTRFSAVDIVIPSSVIQEVIQGLGDRYHMKVELKA